MREIKGETCYSVKEIPIVTIDCKYKNGKYVKFYCDVLTEFSFENYDSKIICKLTTALMSNSLWTEVMFNNLNQNFESFEVTAETFKRNASTGQDEAFNILDHFVFDKMAISFFFEVGGNPAAPIITLTKEFK